jgi:hypothetical protein
MFEVRETGDAQQQAEYSCKTTLAAAAAMPLAVGSAPECILS